MRKTLKRPNICEFVEDHIAFVAPWEISFFFGFQDDFRSFFVSKSFGSCCWWKRICFNKPGATGAIVLDKGIIHLVIAQNIPEN